MTRSVAITLAAIVGTLLHAVGMTTNTFGVSDPGIKDVNQTAFAELLS